MTRSALRDDLEALMMIPGLSGHEDRVRAEIRARLGDLAATAQTDRLGNLSLTLPGDPDLPSVMILAHMDQLGFVVRKIAHDGTLRVHRMGGVPERALLSQAVLCQIGPGRDLPGVIACKSHHVTAPGEKYTVPVVAELHVDTGHTSRAEAAAAGIRIGTPVVYAPRVLPLAGDRIAGTSVDDRAGCAVLLSLARALAGRGGGPTVHLAFTVQEEFNLRGVQPLAAVLAPDIALQLDLMVATDTPETADLGEMVLGGGPGMSLYSFHGRGTLNGVIPHPGVAALAEAAAEDAGLSLQRGAQTGILTDLSHVQPLGVAVLDLGFPMRYSHASLEVCDLRDLEGLTTLLEAMVARIATHGVDLDRDTAAPI